jgi:hypothetical protein
VGNAKNAVNDVQSIAEIVSGFVPEINVSTCVIIPGTLCKTVNGILTHATSA